MRYKDKNKIEALHQAVIDVIISEGYQNLSVAKIAKKAGVSQATLYVYYSDKKAMLGQVYLNVKNLIDTKLFAKVNPTGSVAEQFRLILHNYADAITTYPREAAVMRVFNRNPDLLPPAIFQIGMDLGQPIQQIYQKGIQENSLRPLAPELLIAYTFQPLDVIEELRFRHQQTMTKAEIDTMIEMAWQACRQN